MAQASVVSHPFDAVQFIAPKRARLSLKHQVHSPSKTEPVVDFSFKNQDAMLIDNCVGHNENISPNFKVPDLKLSPFICDDVIVRKHKVSAVGLPNCGNTCYLNSVLQVLRFTPNFLTTLRSLVDSHKWLVQVSSKNSEVKVTDFFLKLHTLFTTMKKQEKFLLNDSEKDNSSILSTHLESFMMSLGEISSTFEEGEQHDAHEFLLTVLSKFDIFSAGIKKNMDSHFSGNPSQLLLYQVLSAPSQHTEKRKLKKRARSQLYSRGQSLLKSSIFDLGFEGKMLHTVKCVECESRLNRIETFTNLEVTIADDSIAEGKVKIQETVDLCKCLVQRTLLSGENKYFCEECYHLTEARLSSEITSLPPVLMLHCSWLRQSSDLDQVEKDNTKITIPLLLKTSENPSIFQIEKDHVYCLYAIVFHVGTSTENGHYVSFIKEASEVTVKSCSNEEETFNLPKDATQNWLFFDDENVSPLCVRDTYDFPYYKFMTISASPCIIFYYKE